jgi:hypothetical protein
MIIAGRTDLKRHSMRFLWRRLPLVGSVLFVLLYLVAAFKYPGGTSIDRNSKGFSWTQNYWCNLLNEYAINGAPNPAKPIALTAMVVLCLSLIIFWYQFPEWTGLKTPQRLVIKVSGFLSMAIGLFVFTGLHDTVTNVAGVFGVIALTGTLIGLWKIGWKKLFYMGIFSLVLVGVNNLLYYTPGLIIYLAVVQKITFLYFLLWICLVNITWLKQPLHHS